MTYVPTSYCLHSIIDVYNTVCAHVHFNVNNYFVWLDIMELVVGVGMQLITLTNPVIAESLTISCKVPSKTFIILILKYYHKRT